MKCPEMNARIMFVLFQFLAVGSDDCHIHIALFVKPCIIMCMDSPRFYELSVRVLLYFSLQDNVSCTSHNPMPTV
jgi:hypothetical protein